MLGRFHYPCLGLPGRCATRWGETGITNRPFPKGGTWVSGGCFHTLGSTSGGDVSNCECASSGRARGCSMSGKWKNVLLAFELWGHIDHAGSECHCLSSERTGVQGLTSMHYQSHCDCISSLLLSPPNIAPGEKIPGDSSVLVSTEILLVRPGCLWTAAIGHL